MASNVEVQLLLTAAASAAFGGVFKKAESQVSKLSANLQDMNKQKLSIEKYQKLSKSLSELSEKQKELITSNGSNSKIIKNLDKIGKTQKDINALEKSLKDSGINMNALSSESDRLTKSLDRIGNAQKRLISADAAYDSHLKKRGDALRSMATTAAAAYGLIGAPVKAAIQFESAMADVKKVVDFDTPKQFKEMGNDIKSLSTTIPMATEEIAAIVAAGGQSGFARDELLGFAESAAKMGVAFDLSADEAGGMMAKWRTSFGMTQSEVITLADKINYLGNTTPATAAQISKVVTKIGPLGEVAGLASGDLAALGAAMVGVGIQEDVAATGIKNLMLDLTAGEAVTGNMTKQLEKLGLTSEQLAKDMQTNAPKAIMAFMEAVRGLDKEEQSSVLAQYFGTESVGAIAPLLTNLENLEEQFNKVGDASQYAGSMQAEYDARAATTENTLQLTKNSLNNLAITLGDTFLPMVAQGAQALSESTQKLQRFVESNGELIAVLGKVATYGMAVLLGLKASAVVWHTMGTATATASKALALYNVYLSATGRAALIAAGGMEKAALGAKLMGLAMKAVPFLAIAGAIAGVGAVIYNMYKKTQQAKLDKIFGNINLSAEQLNATVKKLVDPSGNMQKLENRVNALKNLDDMAQNIDNAKNAIDQMNWKIGVGVKLTTDEQQDYTQAVRDYISQVQSYINTSGQTIGMDIFSLFGSGAQGTKMAGTANQITAALQGTMEGLGKDLADLMNGTFEDEAGNIDVAKIAQDIMNKTAEIDNLVRNAHTEAQIRAQQESINNKYNGGENLSKESWAAYNQELIDSADNAAKLRDDAAQAQVATAYEQAILAQGLVDLAKTDEERAERQQLAAQAAADAVTIQAEAYKQLNEGKASDLQSVNEALKENLDKIGDSYQLAGRAGKKFYDEQSKAIQPYITKQQEAENKIAALEARQDIASVQMVDDVNKVTSSYQGLSSNISSAAASVALLSNASANIKAPTSSFGAFNLMPKIPRNATGTNFFGGGLSLVGERGAELISMARGTQVYPAGKTEDILNTLFTPPTSESQDATITVNYSPSYVISGNDSAKTRQQIEQANLQAQVALKAMVDEAIREFFHQQQRLAM